MTLHLLSATFNLSLAPRDISRWRSAWAEMAGFEHNDFHNHNPGDKNYIHRYPLIQYRSRGGKAGIVALNQATSLVQRILLDKEWTMRWDNQPAVLGVESLRLETYQLHMPGQPIEYRLYNYLPFNDENFALYQSSDDLRTRIDLIEKMLTGHLLGCCEALEYRLPKRLEVTLTDIFSSKYRNLHDISRPCFTLGFKANLYLPGGIGIGKGVSHGYGVIGSQKNAKNNNQ